MHGKPRVIAGARNVAIHFAQETSVISANPSIAPVLHALDEAISMSMEVDLSPFFVHGVKAREG
jgi:hypothetical protein